MELIASVAQLNAEARLAPAGQQPLTRLVHASYTSLTSLVHASYTPRTSLLHASHTTAGLLDAEASLSNTDAVPSQIGKVPSKLRVETDTAGQQPLTRLLHASYTPLTRLHASYTPLTRLLHVLAQICQRCAWREYTVRILEHQQ
jgi:hypothetical protein